MIVRHFEKAIVLAAGACLANAALGAATTPPEVEEARAAAAKLTTIMDRGPGVRQDLPEPPPDWSARMKDRLDPARVPPVDRWPAWLAHRRPNLVPFIPDDPRPVASVGAPRALAGAVDHGRVRIAWEAGDASNAHVASFRIERRELAGEWTKLAELAPDASGKIATSFEDRSVRARATYAYRVVQRAEVDEGCRAPAAGLAPATVEWTADRAVPRDVRVVAVHGSLMAGAGAPPTVAVRVYRWVDELRGWVGKTYFAVRLETDLGRKEVVSGREVDFRSGARLVDARDEDRAGPGLPRRTVVVLRWSDAAEPEEADDVLPADVAPVLWTR